jgi:hypothetical protein
MAAEFHEWTGYAFHLRRRLTAGEQAAIGPAVDCRGTGEGIRRYEAVRALLPTAGVALAMEELR